MLPTIDQSLIQSFISQLLISILSNMPISWDTPIVSLGNAHFPDGSAKSDCLMKLESFGTGILTTEILILLQDRLEKSIRPNEIGFKGKYKAKGIDSLVSIFFSFSRSFVEILICLFRIGQGQKRAMALSSLCTASDKKTIESVLIVFGLSGVSSLDAISWPGSKMNAPTVSLLEEGLANVVTLELYLILSTLLLS